jgi:hypothetical protein
MEYIRQGRPLPLVLRGGDVVGSKAGMEGCDHPICHEER